MFVDKHLFRVFINARCLSTNIGRAQKGCFAYFRLISQLFVDKQSILTNNFVCQSKKSLSGGNFIVFSGKSYNFGNTGNTLQGCRIRLPFAGLFCRFTLHCYHLKDMLL
jgi:hypothetical protein